MYQRAVAWGADSHDPYLALQEQLDRTRLEDCKNDYSFVKGATDDVIVGIKAHKSKPKALFSRVRAVCGKLEMEAEGIGLSFENDKRQLLLPPDLIFLQMMRFLQK